MTADSHLPVSGRCAVITGVSRRQGIGFAVASRLADMGASLFIHHFVPHDVGQPWGADNLEEVLALLQARLTAGATLRHTGSDLAQPRGADELVAAAGAALGHLDILVCNHARSGDDGRLNAISADALDAHWQVNTRSTLLATRAFAAQHDGRDGGRVIWLTSGQGLGPMSGQIAYATSKAALAGITASVAADLIEQGIILNTINPGPVNTGYLDPDCTDVPREVLESLRSSFPSRRFGEPDDPARLIAWLVSDEGRWLIGQVLHTEGGFRR